MEEQNRSLWHHAMISAAVTSLATARTTGPAPGRYRLQAEIAAVHATAPTAEATNWARIIGIFDRLLLVQPSAVVAFNRAIAVGFRDGPDAGLAALEALAAWPDADQLTGHHLLPAARADLHRRAGRYAEAAAGYRQALGLVRNAAERRYLQRRLHESTIEPELNRPGMSGHLLV